MHAFGPDSAVFDGFEGSCIGLGEGAVVPLSGRIHTDHPHRLNKLRVRHGKKV